jgi:hypothetical protein
VQFSVRLARQLGRWPIALVAVSVLAAAVLLPGLGSFGLWEPQERQLADRVAPREELAAKQRAQQPPPPTPSKDPCLRIAPPEPDARSLTNRAMMWGRDNVSDSDAGRRLPLALLGLITVIATAGIAMRLSGPRAGILTGLVLLSMPLLVFQSRQLTSEIGTAAGAALTIYGLLAIGGRGPLEILDSFFGIVALVAGIAIGFYAGGALLGLLVPIGAYAAVHGFGISFFLTLGNASSRTALRVGKRMHWKWAAGREASSQEPPAQPVAEQMKALIATIAVAGIAALLVHEIYSLIEPQPWVVPAQREVLGKAIVPGGCWSEALGALWRPDDDLRYSFDSTFEQIAYGTFPWGIVGPIAIAALIGHADRKKRILGGLALAWAGAAWIAAEVFQRKVGFTVWGGFPAIAMAIGAWVDDLFTQRSRRIEEPLELTDSNDTTRESSLRWMPATVLVGLFVLLAVTNLGKDLTSFPERITSLLVGNDQIVYPKTSRLLGLSTKLWLLVLGSVFSIAFALSMIVWREDPRRVVMRKIARRATVTMFGATVLFGAFWSFGWLPALASNLSSKAMFDTYLDLRKPGDQLAIMGDMGDAPFDYARDTKPEVLTSREQIVAAIARPNRVVAIAPQTELCQLHREIGGKPYFVIDDRNTRSLLLSNRVDGTTDKNPLRTAILHAEPKQIQNRPKGRVVFDNKVELLGWDMPKRVSRGDKFTVRMYYKILQPVGGNWRVLFHFDGALRFNGDHEPIKGRCPTSTWQPGDYIVDTNTVTAGAGAFPPGSYDVWTGFFTGSNPNFKNMTVSEAPPDQRDTVDRVKITTITLD